MKKLILVLMLFLFPLAIFVSEIIAKENSIILTRNETEEEAISNKLELTIVAYRIIRDESGGVYSMKDKTGQILYVGKSSSKAMSPSIKFWIRNVSNETISFPFERGMIWFWEKSIDGQPFKAMGTGDWNPSSLQEKVILNPGETIKGSISGSSYVIGPVSKIQLRYNRKPYYTLVSNQLDLSSKIWGNKTHTNDPDFRNESLTLTIRRDNNRLEAVISNISKEEISFYFETCPICFWSISVNSGKWQSLGNAIHETNCGLKNTLALMPGKNITYGLPQHYLSKDTKTLKIRYRYGTYDEEHMVLESNVLVVQ